MAYINSSLKHWFYFFSCKDEPKEKILTTSGMYRCRLDYSSRALSFFSRSFDSFQLNSWEAVPSAAFWTSLSH